MAIIKGPHGESFSFNDLRADQFPVTLTAFVDGKQIWEVVVEPYVIVAIPPAPKGAEGRVRVRIVTANGEETWAEPPT